MRLGDVVLGDLRSMRRALGFDVEGNFDGLVLLEGPVAVLGSMRMGMMV